MNVIRHEITGQVNIPLKLIKCLGYDTKLFDGEELWGMWSTPSLPLLPGSPWPRVIVPVKISSI